MKTKRWTTTAISSDRSRPAFMGEWLIPESSFKPSYGQRKLPDGRLVQLKQVTAEEFFRRANPALQYLADEISERSGVEAGDNAVAPASLMLHQ
jgi:hypothetical protein